METTNNLEWSVIFHWLDGFFFGTVSNLSLGIFRIALGMVIMFFTFRGAADFTLFTGHRGLFPNDVYLKKANWGFSVFDLFPNSKLFPKIFPYLIIFSAFFFTLGIYTMFFNVLTYILWISLNRRINVLRSSGDALIMIMLFFFIFSEAGQTLSVDRWLQDQSLGLDAVVKAWPLRLMQIQVCVIYFHAFNWKIGSTFWRNGSALMNAVTYKPWGKDWVRNLIREPIISKSLNFLTLFFQIFVPFFIWPLETRLVAIFCGVAMHIGMWISLSLGEFAPLMVSVFALFYEPKAFHAIIALAGL